MNKGKIVYAVLMTLEKAADGYLALDAFSRRGSSVMYGYDLPKSNLTHAIYRLSRDGYVEKSISEGKVIIKLSEAGRDWVLLHKDYDGKDWDGVWRLVIFDIPEKNRKVRDTLRRRLKEWGFVQWQKSVWVGKKPLANHLRELVKKLGVEEWVLVVESSDVGGFNLFTRSSKYIT